MGDKPSGVWGTEVPQRDLGAEPRWGSGGEAPRSHRQNLKTKVHTDTDIVGLAWNSPPTTRGNMHLCPPPSGYRYTSAREGVQNMHHWYIDGHKHIVSQLQPSVPSCITPSLLQLCFSGVVVFQLVSGRAVVISCTAFNSDIVFLQ